MGAGIRKALVVGSSCLALGATVVGARYALRSPLFTVQVVEVEDGSGAEGAPLDSDTITTLAAVPVGKENLFDLSLDGVEKRILSHEWVREVRLAKRFPQTVSISVTYREPRAILQSDRGSLSYVDANGQVFSRLDPALGFDLPVLTGISAETEPGRARIKDALQVIEAWNKAPVSGQAQLASLSFDPERGYRAVMVYGLTGGGRARAWLELGNEPVGLTDLEPQLARLSQVVRYLSAHQASARQIRLDTGKRIVVKMARAAAG